MGNIGEISIRDIQKKYKLGFWYAESIINKLEEIGYIKKKNEYSYKIIQTEQEIDNYIKTHMEELKPQKYKELGWRDNGKPILSSQIKMNVDYYRVILPVFIRRILFSIPQIILISFLAIVFPFCQINNRRITADEYIDLLIICIAYVAVPLNILIRIIQARFYSMRFNNFMLLPKNWFFKRCSNAIDLFKILQQNKEKVHFGNYDNMVSELKEILNRKKSLAEHYADLANNAENENEFYQSINSCISTLEWMTQFEKFDVFPDGQKPSDDIKTINDGMPISIERFQKRMEAEQKRISCDYDYMEGHDFEYFCADILKKNGFENVEVTQGSGDHGIDILAEKDGIAYAIQCKCYSSNIGNAAVQQAHTGKGLYHKDIAVVLTNRYFTAQAKEEAAVLGVKLWDRDKLEEMVGRE